MTKWIKTTLIKCYRLPGMKIFVYILGMASFCTLYLTLISALSLNAAYYSVLPLGVAVTALLLFFFDRKYIRYGILSAIILYTVLAVSAGFEPFKNGMLGFFNAAIKRMNAERHFGYASFAAQNGFGEDFLFMSVVSVWLAGFSAFAVKRSYVFICISAVMLFVQLYIGLYPQFYTAILIVLVYVCLLAVHNGFTVKAACCYLAVAIAVSAAGIPCYLFSGSAALDRFEKSVSLSLENAVYGNSLPGGRLNDSYGMRSSEEVRLKLTLSSLTPSLYLRGFVGSELNGTEWEPSDKNIYVENGYQGLLSYISEGGLLGTQYAEYSRLCGHSNKYELKVENVSADKRYIYAPYTLSEYSVGNAYYDMGLRGGLFSPRTYTHTIFAADESGERVTQAEWIMNDLDRTAEMDYYIELEGQYRAFVYDNYLSLDESTATAVNTAVGGFATDSINTATQFIRSYFLGAYIYADECDLVENSFAEEFFGGKIEKANAAYFATAATCMFRALGFASRYVEGYSVFAVDEDEASEMLTVDVTGDNTHAWTEVYFDGIGWLPVEVTPTFFTERPPDTTVAPEDPNGSETPPSDTEDPPEAPAEDNPQEPEEPEEPKPTDPIAEEPGGTQLIVALKVLVPLVSVVFGVLAVMLFFIFRRDYVRMKRRKKLSCDGKEFGDAAYEIMKHDCKHFGGFDGVVLEKYGIPENGTARFVRIIECCVYSGRPIKEDERKYVLSYIGNVQSKLISNCGFFRALYFKYVLCLVI